MKTLLSVYGVWEEGIFFYAKVAEPIRGGWRYLGKIIIGMRSSGDTGAAEKRRQP